jgi:hypothetical protein
MRDSDSIVPIYAPMRETCDRFGCGPSKMYDLLGEGLIEGKKLGKRLLINQQSARRYFESLPPATSTIRPSARVRRRAAGEATA